MPVDIQIKMVDKRDSNIELLRIVAMWFIIAHHYVVNSGVWELMSFETQLTKTIWMQLIGMWGKVAINPFVIITGYFMCTNRLTLKRFIKIFFEIVFYGWSMWGVLYFAGYSVSFFRPA